MTNLKTLRAQNEAFKLYVEKAGDNLDETIYPTISDLLDLLDEAEKMAEFYANKNIFVGLSFDRMPLVIEHTKAQAFLSKLRGD